MKCRALAVELELTAAEFLGSSPLGSGSHNQATEAGSRFPSPPGEAMREPAAIKGIEKHGIVLAYPMANRPELPSLWSLAYPRSEMRWDWSSEADPRVAEIWHLRGQLASGTRVVYAKWFHGRATFFSRPVFQALLGRLEAEGDLFDGLPPESRAILEVLDESSPQSMKQVRAQVELVGKHNEKVFAHAVKSLWSRLLIVGAGEVEDGAFPSLAIGNTALLFEELWRARGEPNGEGNQRLDAALAGSPALQRELARSAAVVARQGRLPTRT